MFMENLEYYTTDKATWGPGDWHGEPDKKQWQDKATGYPCLIVRGPLGAWCGYVGVPKGHPLYRKDYDGLPAHEKARQRRKSKMQRSYNRKYGKAFLHQGKCSIRRKWGEGLNVEVHGGLTYAGTCHGQICHETDSDDKVWWLGFDCAHYNDLIPQMAAQIREVMKTKHTTQEYAIYRDVAYVTNEVESLAKQLKEMAA